MVCHFNSSSVRPLNVLPTITNPEPSSARAPRCRFDNQPCRRPCPHSTASTIRSSVWTGLTFRHDFPRRPASYGAAAAFTTTPSCPAAKASTSTCSPSIGESVTTFGTRHSPATRASSDSRSVRGASIRSTPSRWRRSKKNGRTPCSLPSGPADGSGDEPDGPGSSAEPPPRQLTVSWNSCGRPSGPTPIASPSNTARSTGSDRTAATTPGTRSVISFRFRVQTRTSSP